MLASWSLPSDLSISDEKNFKKREKKKRKEGEWIAAMRN